jgi:hypothetical protein
MAVDDDDLLAAVACHLVSSLLQQFQLQVSAVGYSSRLVLGLKNLAEIILGEDNRVFPLGRMHGGVAHVQQVGT